MGPEIISLALFFIAGIANAIMDTLEHHFSISIFKNLPSWDAKETWKNKWKNGDPEQGPRFPGSTTVFVFTTDPWHFFKMIMISSVAAAVAIHLSEIWYWKAAWWLAIKTAWWIGFKYPYERAFLT